MNRFLKIVVCVLFTVPVGAQTITNKELINMQLDSWHRAAANADYDAFFEIMTDDGVFLGTDAMENWQNKAFRAYSKPHFDRGKAWNFTAVQRNIYVDEEKDFAWFDELLDTQMKLCRGSGVLKKVNGVWKLAHYVLSIAIPNEYVTEVVELKKVRDSLLVLKLKEK